MTIKMPVSSDGIKTKVFFDLIMIRSQICVTPMSTTGLWPCITPDLTSSLFSVSMTTSRGRPHPLQLGCCPSIPFSFHSALSWIFLLAVLSPLASARLLDPPVSPLSGFPPARWFPQILDHENIKNKEIWKQRYWISKEHYREGGPSILMIGGEGEASPKWLVGESTLVQYAKQQVRLLISNQVIITTIRMIKNTISRKWHEPSNSTNSKDITGALQGAAIVLLEHRFYGQSRPTNSTRWNK